MLILANVGGWDGFPRAIGAIRVDEAPDGRRWRPFDGVALRSRDGSKRRHDTIRLVKSAFRRRAPALLHRATRDGLEMLEMVFEGQFQV